MKDGQPIDGFAGALPEKEVRELLEKYLPKPWEKFVTDAQAFIMVGDFTSALPLLRQAYDESKHDAAIACLLAQCHLELNRIDNAEAILATIKMADQDAHYEQLLAQVELKKQAAKTPELVALEAAHTREPDNLQVAYQLAIQYHAEDAYRPALELLMGILRKERNFAEGAAKKTFMDILTALGKGDALAIEFQRKLFTLLY
jgi:putative thioredoxin